MKHIQATVKLLSGLSLGLMLQTAWAGNITDIKVTSLNDSKKIVKIKFDRDVVEPKGFVTGTPPTIALDFGQTGLNLAQQDFQYNDSLLGKILAAENNGRARLAIDLRNNSEYYTERKGDEIWVYITSKTTTPAVTESIKATASTSSNIKNDDNASQLPSNNASAAAFSGVGIDFRKGNGGRGEVTLNLPNPNTRFDVKKANDRLIITLPDTSINAAEQKKLDVTTFGTPVRFVNLTRNNAQTQLEIVTSGPWSYQNKLENGRQVFHILPQSNVTQAGLSKKNQNFKGSRVTLDFQNIEVRTILQILAKESGMNIVASDSVQGNMTISLKDVPWDQALQLVLDARDLDKRQSGNIINVAPREELLSKDKRDLTAKKELEDLGPLLSQSFQLKYKSVEEFKDVLDIKSGSTNSGDSRSILSPRGSALIDPATNTLIINDVYSVIKKLQALVEELDVPSQQVMVEARIVRATTDFTKEMGVKWGILSQGITNNNHLLVGGSDTTLWNLREPEKDDDTGGWKYEIERPQNLNVDLGVTSAGASRIAFGLISLSDFMLDLELSALQADGYGEVISTPKVLTADKQNAKVASGTQIPYQSSEGGGVNAVSTTEFIDATLSLDVTPSITPDGKVQMQLNITSDSPGAPTPTGQLTINKNAVNTNVLVDNGETVVLGGIFEQQTANSQTKVPFLGDIPYIGRLFRKDVKSENKRELLIFVTPRIVNDSVSRNH